MCNQTPRKMVRRKRCRKRIMSRRDILIVWKRQWMLCSRMRKGSSGPGLMLKLKGEAWNQYDQVQAGW